MRFSKFLLIVLLFVHPFVAKAQTLGRPRFGSLQQDGFDTVNRQNLNVVFAIPAVSSPGRGLNLNFGIPYNSQIWVGGGTWQPVTDSTGKPTWGWNTTGLLGTTPYYKNTVRCYNVNTDTWVTITEYTGYRYVEPDGTTHFFSLDFYTPSFQANGCGAPTGPKTGYAGDGYYVDATTPTLPTVYSPAGIKITAGLMKDTNGNYLSSTVVNSSETDWTDARGQTALKIITSSSSIQYEYPDTSGTYRTLTLNLTTFNIKTNFGCAGSVEYTGTASLPTSLSLPNGQSYSFAYEPTPGYSGYYTARLKRVTLPTGGYYEYDYTGSNDGVSCVDYAAANMNRVVNDGTTSNTWQYARAQSGSNWQTTVTAPQMPYDSAANQTVFTFGSTAPQWTKQIYQGSASGGTLLRTINTTFASNGSPSAVVTILEDNQTQNEVETTYDSNWILQTVKEHDYGTGTPGSVLRTTNYSYLSGTAYTAANILDRVITVTVADNTGTTKFRQDIAYDESSYVNSACVTGAAQHDDTNYGCSFTTRGLPTSVTSYATAATQGGPITRHSYYDSLGNRVQADVACCQTQKWNFSSTTQYAFPDSAVRGPSGTQLTTSFIYNTWTGLLATVTDPSNQTTSYAYDTLKRPTTVTRPDQAQITYSYNDAQHTVALTTPVQGSNVVKRTKSLDGLGRPTQVSATDSSGSTLISTVQRKYDPRGGLWQVSNPYTTGTQFWTQTQVDAVGRSSKTVLQDNSQQTYSYSGAGTRQATKVSG